MLVLMIGPLSILENIEDPIRAAAIKSANNANKPTLGLLESINIWAGK